MRRSEERDRPPRRRWARHRVARGCRERGYVTAETAVVLPVVAVVLAAALWAVSATTAQLRCVDAARDAARAAARGDDDASVLAIATAAAPAHAQVSVARTDTDVVVIVRARVGAAGGVLAALPAPTAAATAVAAPEGSP
jgi:Flp pilus assembly protein TadG